VGQHFIDLLDAGRAEDFDVRLAGFVLAPPDYAIRKV
jgi:hypothetical protein